MTDSNGQPDNNGQPDPDNDPDNLDPDNTGQPDQDNDPDAWTPPDKATFEKLIEKAKTRDQKLREAQAKIKQLESPDSKPDEPDPVAQANARLIKSSFRASLATAGVTDKEDQAEVLKVLNLSGVEVDDDGEVDTDALDEIVAKLRKAFSAPAEKPRKIGGRITGKDQGGSGETITNPDSARRRRFITGSAR